MSIEDLRKKITSPEDMPRNMSFLSQRFMGVGGMLVTPPWWLKREWLRIENEVYPEATAVIVQLNNITPQFALHISEEDRTQIAFTPDKASGEADRQVRTTLARFITKYYSHLPDTDIRDMQAAHLAEVDDNIEILQGEAIVSAYASGSVGACMSKEANNFQGGFTPAVVYDMPNISMAVLRNSSGAISARSMLYTPTPDDKRYIRVYGDTLLTKKLTRLGYKPGTWHGAEFKVVRSTKHPDSQNVYVFPYLDGNGRLGGPEHSYVGLIDGKLYGLTEDAARRIRALEGERGAVCATSTSGIVVLTNTSSESFRTTCAISGKALNLLVDDVISHWNGTEIVNVSSTFKDDMHSAGIIHKGTQTSVYIKEDSPVFHTRGTRYVDCEETRRHLGWGKLSSILYPDDQVEWYTLRSMVSTDAGYIRPEDSVQVATMVDGQASWKAVHESKIDKTFTKVHSLHLGKPTYADSTVKVVKTTTGRKVVIGLHDVVTLYTGEVCFSRSAHSRAILGKTYHCIKGGLADMTAHFAPGTEVYDQRVKELLDEYVGDGHSKTMAAARLIASWVLGYARIRGVSLYHINDSHNVTWAELWAIPEVSSSELGKSLNRLMQAEAVPVNEELETEGC